MAERQAERQAGRQATVRRTERWFVNQGMPQLIEGYGFRSHMLARMLPYLTVVGLWISFLNPDYRRWFANLVLLVAIALPVFIVLAALARQRVLRMNRPVAIAVIAAYFLLPLASTPLYVRIYDQDLARTTGFDFGDSLLFVAVAGLTLNTVFFAIGYVTTAYGLLTLIRRSLGQAFHDLPRIGLHARSLPMLLFVTLFFFFSDELWLLTNRLHWWRVLVLLLVFAAIAVLAVVAQLREEITRVEQDMSPQWVVASCKDTPLESYAPELAPKVEAVPLRPRAAANVYLVLATSQLVQAAVVALGLFAFFIVAGLLILDNGVAEAWIGGPPNPSPLLPFIPAALLRGAVLLAGFGGMYFTITAMTDAEYRRRFFEPVVEELERMLAVRAAYLVLRRA